jgi:hypothetical protein
MMKGVGSGVGYGSGSISQRYGSGDPDPDLVPHQNVPNTGSKDKVCAVVSTTLCSSDICYDFKNKKNQSLQNKVHSIDILLHYLDSKR